jgi:hypothetical protein
MEPGNTRLRSAFHQLTADTLADIHALYNVDAAQEDVAKWARRSVMPDTILDGSGEQTPGRRPLEGTDLEIAYNLLGDDLVLRVNKAGVQVFGVVLEDARKAMTAKQLLELKAEKSDLVVSIGPRKDTVANVGFALGRATSKLIKATREKMNKP